MFLPMFRVVVAAVFVCVLSVAAVPAYAVPLGDGQAVEKAESDWLQAAVAWLRGVFGTDDPAVPESEISITPELMNGSCIDPFGRCG